MLLAIGHSCWDVIAPMTAYPAEDTKCEIPSFFECGGGPAATAACVGGLWGVPPVLASVIGHDFWAQRVLEDLGRYRVNCSFVEVRPNHTTPVSFIMVNESNGSRTVVNRKAATAPLPITASQWKERLPQAPTVILTDGHEIDASLSALEAFPGVPCVLDGGSWRPKIDILANRVSHLAVSARFAQQATGMDPLQRNRSEGAMELLRKRFPKPAFAAITLGVRGVIWDDGHRQHVSGGLPVTAVDTTGAGDIWHGAFACAVAWGWSLPHCVAVANAAAALSTTKPGGRTSIPSRDEALAGAARLLNPAANPAPPQVGHVQQNIPHLTAQPQQQYAGV